MLARGSLQRFTFLLLAVSAIGLIQVTSGFAADKASPPNVLLILTDDQGYGDFSLHGNPHVSTPHIDGLAKAGLQFERFYVNSFCAPTRAALLTGRYPLRCGVFGVTHNQEAMRINETTSAEALKSAGLAGAYGLSAWTYSARYFSVATLLAMQPAIDAVLWFWHSWR
jgi:arylsulfatase A